MSVPSEDEVCQPDKVTAGFKTCDVAGCRFLGRLCVEARTVHRWFPCVVEA